MTTSNAIDYAARHAEDVIVAGGELRPGWTVLPESRALRRDGWESWATVRSVCVIPRGHLPARVVIVAESACGLRVWNGAASHAWIVKRASALPPAERKDA